MAAENGIVGDSFGTELPETVVPQQDLSAERNAAKFSRTKEFKLLKDHLESRITFYQTYLPNGDPTTNADPAALGSRWAAANIVIAEFKAVLDAYERAREIVEQSN